MVIFYLTGFLISGRMKHTAGFLRSLVINPGKGKQEVLTLTSRGKLAQQSGRGQKSEWESSPSRMDPT